MKESLNFSWSFIKGFKDEYLIKLDKVEASEVNIPHNPVEIPYNYFSEKNYQGLFTYEKLFDVDNYDDKKVYILHFEGYMFLADIYLNGDSGVRHDRVSIKDDLFLDMPITIPLSAEQEKISKLFELIDRRIAVQSGLIEDLKNVKKCGIFS